MTAPVVEQRSLPARRDAAGFLWLDLTRKCQLRCLHCLNDSGPEGQHGEMTRADWLRVIDQGAATDVRAVQLFGGEPLLHPNSLELAEHALRHGMAVEVYSNLVHVPGPWWDVLRRSGASLATSYYSDSPEEHNAITRRPSHARTRANIIRAVTLHIPIRVGIIDCGTGQRVGHARRELTAMGVERITSDTARPFGRAACGREPNTSGLCGRCGDARASVGPDGMVTPCVFSTWLSAGNVRDGSLEDILVGNAMVAAKALISSSIIRLGGNGGDDDDDNDNEDECSPGFPGSECTPRN
ncbi:radical SAM/SPASM domain-containing protein [Streptomyces longisporoflavus]|uniref:Radical SAM/SPASM domain-containing protein n=1 Tax=Streptomyces longisporoflavus TaxID=28044 RepID=A0ABW7R492_9ACTN